MGGRLGHSYSKAHELKDISLCIDPSHFLNIWCPYQRRAINIDVRVIGGYFWTSVTVIKLTLCTILCCILFSMTKCTSLLYCQLLQTVLNLPHGPCFNSIFFCGATVQCDIVEKKKDYKLLPRNRKRYMFQLQGNISVHLHQIDRNVLLSNKWNFISAFVR